MGVEQAQEMFIEAARAIAEMNDKVIRILINGTYIYNHDQDLFWFEHVMERNDCEPGCGGHRYWATVVPYIREFDLMVEKDMDPRLRGYRVVRNPIEALEGSWEEGSVKS